MAFVDTGVIAGERLNVARSRDAIIAAELNAQLRHSPTTCSKRNGLVFPRFVRCPARTASLGLATHFATQSPANALLRVRTGCTNLYCLTCSRTN
jgi:hypothetical protein